MHDLMKDSSDIYHVTVCRVMIRNWKHRGKSL